MAKKWKSKIFISPVDHAIDLYAWVDNFDSGDNKTNFGIFIYEPDGAGFAIVGHLRNWGGDCLFFQRLFVALLLAFESDAKKFQ